MNSLLKTNMLLWLLAGCVTLTGLARADDWQQWRGKQRNGISEEKGLLSEWPANGPKLVWEASGLGNGYSTPSVADGRLFVIGNQGMEKEEVIAIDVTNGKKLWSVPIGKVGTNEGPQYPGTRSTPTVSGDLVYALGSDGDLACLEAKSGKIVWTKNLHRDFGGKPGMWAYAESPLIDGDTLICSPGGSTSSVIALKKSDGATIWKTPLPDGNSASFSSPVVAQIDGVKQYILYLSKGVVGLRADSGEQLWSYSKTSDAQANIATPIVQGNLIYTAASRVGGGLIEVKSDKTAVKEIYFDKSLPSAFGGSVLVGENLYGASGNTMMCVDFATGRVRWQDRGIGSASICYADGRLYLHGEDNRVALIAASDQGYQQLGSFEPPHAEDRGKSKAWCHPVVANGHLFIRDVGKIWCYDIRSSK